MTSNLQPYIRGAVWRRVLQVFFCNHYVVTAELQLENDVVQRLAPAAAVSRRVLSSRPGCLNHSVFTVCITPSVLTV